MGGGSKSYEGEEGLLQDRYPDIVQKANYRAEKTEQEFIKPSMASSLGKEHFRRFRYYLQEVAKAERRG